MESALLLLLPPMLALLAPIASTGEFNTTYVYRLGSEGTAEVLVLVEGYEGDVIEVSVDHGVLHNSIVVSLVNGTPLPFEVSDNTVAFYVDGARSTVVIAYAAIVGDEEEEGVIRAVVSPAGRAVVYLPRGAALLGVNATASVSVEGGSIVLVFDSPGTYEIVYACFETGSAEHTLYVIAVLASVTITAFIGAWLLARRKTLGISSGGLDDRDQAILELLRREGPMTVTELSRRLGLSKSTAYRRLTRLTRMGYVEREVREGQILYKAKV